MRFAVGLCLWAVAATAQVPRIEVPPAPPTPPPVIVHDGGDVRQSMRTSTQGLGTLAILEYSIGQPTDDEQYYLELINRARANPTTEGIRLATTLDPDLTSSYRESQVDLDLMQAEFAAIPVMPPLAMNEKLMQAARGHSQDMFQNAFQGHNSSNGTSFGPRINASGYFGSLAENVYSYASSTIHGHGGFEVDWGADHDGTIGGMQSHRGHRANIHRDLREVGIGVVLGSKTIGDSSVGPHLVTQDFGTAPADLPFVTGVAYYDVNGNSFYDPGEGIGGLTVNVNGASFQAVTANTGGYAVPVAAVNTTRAVTFTGLGFNGGSNAVIADFNNAKVDFKPVYVPPVLTGPANAATGVAADYTFTPVAGAIGYQWRRAKVGPAVADPGTNLTRVTPATTGGYNTIVSGAYHLAHVTPPEPQTMTYNAVFRVGNAASLQFQSKLQNAGKGEAARVQVSLNEGLSWEDVYIQSGTDAVGEAGFNARSASLEAYAGKEIRLRFLYSFGAGLYFPAGNSVGWFIKTISFTNVSEISDAESQAVSEDALFEFTPPAPGNYVLAVRPLVTGNRPMPYGPLLAVTAADGPPPPAEVSLQQPAGTQLADGAAQIDYGPVNLTASVIRTFTVANVGAEPLTGLAVSIDGTHAGDFVAGSLGAVTLNGGQSTTFTVTFTPGGIGARTAVLHLASNDSNENPFDVTLEGNGIAAPDITLQQPEDSDLADGTSSITYGTAILGTSVTRTFTIVNDGLLPLESLALSVVGAHAAEFVAQAPALATLAPGASTTFDVTFTPAGIGARAATLRVASNDPDENPFDVNLNGTGSVVTPPSPQAEIRQVGGAQITFTVAAAPDTLSFQWRKNGANVAGATASSLTINAPKLTDAGAYTVQVKRGTQFTTSAAAQLAVVENVPKTVVVASGAAVTLKVAAAGNGLTYLWKKQGGVLPPESRLGGLAGKKTTSNSLVIQKLDATTDSGTYFCEVTNAAGMEVGCTTTLQVFGEPPVITKFEPPAGIVSGEYSYPPEMDPAIAKTPTSFSATGLPPGIKVDPKTGFLGGKPTRAGTYLIKLTASNSKGKSAVASWSVTIATFPADLAGSYVGRVERSPLNTNLGGRIDFTVGATGAVSGSLTMGATKLPFSGGLNVDVDEIKAPRLDAKVKRAGKPVPAPLDLAVEISANEFTAATKVSGDGQEAFITGWRQIWGPAAQSAARYLGYYTAAFPLAGPEGAPVPQGAGYGAFTVTANGKLTLAGKTADGESLTCASFMGPGGEVLVYQPLYTTLQKGSLAGQLQIGLGGDIDSSLDNPITGSLNWLRPVDGRPTARTYELGFGDPTPIELSAVGARYAWTAGSMILGLTPPADRAELIFAAGGLDESRRNPDVEFDVDAKNRITMPPVGALNEAAAKLAVTTSTGLFKGTFILDDEDPRKPPPATPVILKRTVTYQGVIIRDGANLAGLGYFLLPKLPQQGQTPANTDILSGKVTLQPAP